MSPLEIVFKCEPYSCISFIHLLIFEISGGNVCVWIKYLHLLYTFINNLVSNEHCIKVQFCTSATVVRSGGGTFSDMRHIHKWHIFHFSDTAKQVKEASVMGLVSFHYYVPGILP